MTTPTTTETQTDAANEYVFYWPRLTRFYGLRPGVLARMPNVLIEVYLKELPILEAEEKLAAIMCSSFPHMEDKDRKDIQRRLNRAAQLFAPVAKLDPTKPEGFAALGIKVVRE